MPLDGPNVMAVNLALTACSCHSRASVIGMSQPFRVGGSRFRLSFNRAGDLVYDERDDTEAASDVTVHIEMFQDGGHFYCGEVIVSTNARLTTDPPNRVLAEDDSHLSIDSRVWRSLRIGELVEATADMLRRDSDKVALAIGDDYIKRSVALPAPSTRRGRRSPLTSKLLAEVVGPAYLTAPRRPVQAVQAALAECADFQGSGPCGDVTIDQARKAVARARRAGLIPPAVKGVHS